MTDPEIRELLGELVVGLDHVGIATDDLEAAVRLHTTMFGMRVIHREVNHDQQVAEAMLAAGLSETGSGPATLVQLVAPLGSDSPFARSLERRGPGLHHLALRVTDVVAAADRLRAAGLRVLDERPRPGTGGSSITFVHPGDGGGVLVELVQHPSPDPRGLAGSVGSER